ncbi:MAG TPA: pentapeptide repeat-containing protein [Terracidiphilus sp.]|nr:pentapeptide repeat-containing protein [Terracidiphilus sp.]
MLEETERSGLPTDFARFVFPVSDFRNRKFETLCDFREAIFTRDALFNWSTFSSFSSFRDAKFMQRADFSSARFMKEVNFRGTAFPEGALFHRATFSRHIDFNAARFSGEVEFEHAVFSENATFLWSKFAKGALFENSVFSKKVEFTYAEFLGPVKFKNTEFRHDPELAPGLDFSKVSLQQPELVEFGNVDLGQALFYETDISRVDFTLVRWRDRGRSDGPFARRFWQVIGIAGRPAGRFCLFEEVVNLQRSAGEVNSDLWAPKDTPDERNFGLIAETYQQLKRNYDARGDYWTAGHFHFGEMEMKRLHSSWRLRPLRWLNRNFSLVALYKYASSYGESYVRPLAWLAVVLVFFSLLNPMLGFYPSTGLVLNAPGLPCNQVCSLNYWNYATFFSANPSERPAGWFGMLLHSFMTSVSVAGFQKEFRYMPSYPWGRLLALLELLLTTTLGGLFALAIRRQFKRS